MKTVFILSFIANLIVIAVSAAISPASVAIHFGPGGHPDSWAPSHVNALLMAGVNFIIFIPLLFSAVIVRKLPKSWINLPNKDYWLSDENIGRTESMMAREIFMFGTAAFGFLFVVNLLTLQANLSTPVKLREDLFWPSFGIFMAFTIYWTIRIIAKFRIPGKKQRKG